MYFTSLHRQAKPQQSGFLWAGFPVSLGVDRTPFVVEVLVFIFEPASDCVDIVLKNLLFKYPIASHRTQDRGCLRRKELSFP